MIIIIIIVISPSPNASEGINDLRKQKGDILHLSKDQEATEPKPVNHSFHFGAEIYWGQRERHAVIEMMKWWNERSQNQIIYSAATASIQKLQRGSKAEANNVILIIPYLYL